MTEKRGYKNAPRGKFAEVARTRWVQVGVAIVLVVALILLFPVIYDLGKNVGNGIGDLFG